LLLVGEYHVFNRNIHRCQPCSETNSRILDWLFVGLADATGKDYNIRHCNPTET